MTEKIVQKRYFEVGRSLTEVISLVALGLGAIEPTKHHRRLYKFCFINVIKSGNTPKHIRSDMIQTVLNSHGFS